MQELERAAMCESGCTAYKTAGEAACFQCCLPQRVKAVRNKANDNVGFLPDFAKVEEACANLLAALLINYQADPNTKETPYRMAKMFLHETMRGRYEPRPDLKAFPNQNGLDQLYVVGPIRINSMCSHHMVPIVGKVWMGILPNPEGEVLGLSKFARLADWIFRRPQIQEEATIQLANEVEEICKPDGLAVAVRAEHLCMTWRGVMDPESKMVTSVTRGKLREDKAARDEFFSLIKGTGF